MNRKAQAAAAATLVGIIAALIVLYILVIPPEERQKLLEGEDYVSEAEKAAEANVTLFELEASKKFLPLETKEFEQGIPNINIYIQEEGTELKRIDTLYAKKSIFSEKLAILNFEIIDLADAENVLLNLIVKEGKGRLIIKLNENEIYNSEITTTNIEPIKLKEYLIQGTNTIEFSVSSPGAAFWRTNEYSLEDITVTADMLRRDAQESRNIFILTSAEKENMEKVKLRFVPACSVEDVGKLDAWINNYNLYAAVPDCGYPVVLEFSPTYLVKGENVLKFKTERGRYLIEQIKITSELKEIELPVYYFQLTEKQYRYVNNETANVTLSMKFVDDIEVKQADITINGDLLRLDQEEISYSENINNYIEEGNNAIKIDPDKAIDVVDLKIVYTD
jgi:hypothetical protein